MANLDVSFLTSDTTFADVFVLISRAESVNEWGELVVTQTTTAERGSIQPLATAKNLTDLPQGAVLTDHIKIFARAKMQPRDLISWCGRAYVVENVEPWAHFGDGFYVATCILETPNG